MGRKNSGDLRVQGKLRHPPGLLGFIAHIVHRISGHGELSVKYRLLLRHLHPYGAVPVRPADKLAEIVLILYLQIKIPDA